MKYSNPVIKGFYPDPSVCKVEDTYYLVCSSMQYFPGVPLFESKDLVNWTQIGHCLTRETQIYLDKVNSSGGVFAPTIRYHEGRFYMTTTNDTTHQNFYIWTDNIYGEWSDPVFVDQGGIDPSLYFEEGKAYFMSNGADDEGIPGIVQCEINIETGEKLSPSKTIWQGSGGRYLEAPHMYKINGMYYLVAAEGGTEYGHMVTYARSNSPFGEFQPYEHNPVLTNRNLGGYEIQGVGHGDLIQDNNGNWWMLHLGFRQTGQYDTFHHLGREVFLTPITFNVDGWFTAGDSGITEKIVVTDRMSDELVQKHQYIESFDNTKWDIDWCYLRWPRMENYQLGNNEVILHGSDITLDEADAPTFIGIRQKDFNALITCDVCVTGGEAGITIYMDENHHYDLLIRNHENSYEVTQKLNVGNIKTIQNRVDIGERQEVTLFIKSSNLSYTFGFILEGKEVELGTGLTRYLSSEVAGGFTGVMIGLYAHSKDKKNEARFSNFKCEYTK